MPPTLQRPEAPLPPRRSCASIVIAAVLILLVATMLLVLPTGGIGPAMVIGGGLFVGVMAFHYFIWGRVIKQVLRDDDDAPRDVPAD